MRVIALDTTARDGSVALLAATDGQCLIDERPGDPSRTHAERLPGAIAAVIDAHGLGWSDIDLFAVASGPGSFTGLRIGIATIQGLALAAGRPLVAVSALDALAQHASQSVAPGGAIGAWMDARRGDVFAALFTVTAAPVFEAERLVELEGPAVADTAATLDRVADHLRDGPSLFVGDGAVLYAARIEARWATPGVRILPPPLLAGAIGRIALARARRGETIHPSLVQPLYVRRPDAEVERERKKLGIRN